MPDAADSERTGPPRRGQRLARERGLRRPHRRAVGGPSAPAGVRLERVVVVLVEPREAGNLGQTARAMLNMGLTRLTLVRPHAAPLGAEARRRAMHAWEVLKHARRVDDLATALSDTVYSVAFTTGAGRSEARPAPFDALLDDVARAAAGGDVALVFGNEVDGLANVDLRRCTARARLATSPALPSLNLAQAVLLAGAAVYGHRRPVEDTAPPATAAELDRLWRRLWEVLDRSRALPLQDPGRLFARLQQTLARQSLSWPDVKLWLGVLGDVAKALDHPAKIKPAAAPPPFDVGPDAGAATMRDEAPAADPSATAPSKAGASSTPSGNADGDADAAGAGAVAAPA